MIARAEQKDTKGKGDQPTEPEPVPQSSTDCSELRQDLNFHIEPLPSPPTPAARTPSAPGAYFADATNAESTLARKVPFALVGADSAQTDWPVAGANALEDSSSNRYPTEGDALPEKMNLTVANLISDLELLPKAKEYDPETASNSNHSNLLDGTREDKTYERVRAFGLIAILLVIIVGATLALTIRDEPEEGTSIQSTNAKLTDNSTNPLPLNATIISLLPNHTKWQVLHDPFSPQALAFQWLLEDPSVGNYTQDRLQQRFALSTIYYATNGDTSWRNTSRWLSFEHHECTWFHQPTFSMKHLISRMFDGFLDEFEHPSQFCSDDGLYQNLWLDQNRLQGTLPLELYLLTNLKTLSMGLNNDLRGTVSSLIGQLTDLEFIAMYRLETPGTIPTQIGLLTNLRGLGLNDNKLYGSIPTELHLLTDLQTLILSRNRDLVGTIPSNIHKFSKLRWLSIDECNLRGTIPTQMGRLKHMEWMVFGGNHFTGHMPSEIGQMESLKILSVWGNDLSGRLPSQLGQLKEAFLFSLKANSFTGTIAAEFGNLVNLTIANFQDNRGLSGTIPPQLSLLTKMEELSFRNNQMTGSIPSQLGLLVNMQRFSVTNNSLSGTVPHQLEGMIRDLYSASFVGNSNLSGTIPEALCFINATCMESAHNPCEGVVGLNFDCTEQLCGCNCSCKS